MPPEPRPPSTRRAAFGPPAARASTPRRAPAPLPRRSTRPLVPTASVTAVGLGQRSASDVTTDSTPGSTSSIRNGGRPPRRRARANATAGAIGRHDGSAALLRRRHRHARPPVVAMARASVAQPGSRIASRRRDAPTRRPSSPRRESASSVASPFSTARATCTAPGTPAPAPPALPSSTVTPSAAGRDDRAVPLAPAAIEDAQRIAGARAAAPRPTCAASSGGSASCLPGGLGIGNEDARGHAADYTWAIAPT